jgi:hypothetical protein
MKKLIIFIGMLLITACLFSQERQRESYYQQRFAEAVNGETEVVLSDRTRVDIVTDTHVIEVDFAEKWAESIGQSLHYEGMMATKKAGVLLVIEGKNEERFLDRLVGVAAKHGIDIWVWNWTTDEWSKLDYKFEIKYLY